MSIRSTLKKLDKLYEITGQDWVLEIHHILTEPTCPTVCIRPEDSNMARYRIDCDSIEEGVQRAVDLVYREVILGEKIEPECPFTNPDDHKPKPWQP